jgi:hypothetical protein
MASSFLMDLSFIKIIWRHWYENYLAYMLLIF